MKKIILLFLFASTLCLADDPNEMPPEEPCDPCNIQGVYIGEDILDLDINTITVLAGQTEECNECNIVTWQWSVLEGDGLLLEDDAREVNFFGSINGWNLINLQITNCYGVTGEDELYIYVLPEVGDGPSSQINYLWIHRHAIYTLGCSDWDADGCCRRGSFNPITASTSLKYMFNDWPKTYTEQPRCDYFFPIRNYHDLDQSNTVNFTDFALMAIAYDANH